MNTQNLKLIKKAADRGRARAPCLVPDGGFQEGTLIVLEYPTVCVTCGEIAKQRMSFVWKGTTTKHLDGLSMGASVKHYFTDCKKCGVATG